MMKIAELQERIGVTVDGIFGPKSKAALLARMTNKAAPALTDDDFAAVAARWGVPVAHIKGVRKVEAPRGAFDAQGRPSILYERHKFRKHTTPPGRFNASHPALSGPSYPPGGYGAFSVQYGKLVAACALDPLAAFKACSWGAFQVLGENAVALGYDDAVDMAFTLVSGEMAHLDSFVRYVETNRLVEKFKACRPHDPVSCQPFVMAYNGLGFRKFRYDVKLAEAIA